MIARPVNRPRPIPFDSPSPSLALADSQPQNTPRPVSWAASSGPAGQTGSSSGHIGHIGHLAQEPPAPYLVQRRSPVIANATQAKAAQVHASSTFEPLAPPARATPSQPLGNTEARSRGAGPSSAAGLGGGELHARFVGQGALSVRSSVTGRHYRFQGHGDCLRVDKLDLVLLKRIPDLVLG